MLGKKETTTYHPDVTTQMQQFAICLKRNIRQENDVQMLNQWCYENHCVPLNFDMGPNYIFAVVKRI